MPLQRRLPKFGFTNLKRVEFKPINLSTLEELAAKKNPVSYTHLVVFLPVSTAAAEGFPVRSDRGWKP